MSLPNVIGDDAVHWRSGEGYRPHTPLVCPDCDTFAFLDEWQGDHILRAHEVDYGNGRVERQDLLVTRSRWWAGRCPVCRQMVVKDG